MAIDPSRLILIVTGAHLRAEAEDRPLAYRLREEVLRAAEIPPRRVLVCSDLWYLNQPELRLCPTVSVGPPGVNALTARLAAQLPLAFGILDRLSVQLDVEWVEPLAACWGRDAVHTAQAIEAFVDRYLGGFLAAAMRGWDRPP